MKATVKTSTARAEDVEMGDVIRFDTHHGRDARPAWSHWMRVLDVRTIQRDTVNIVLVLDNGTGPRGVAEKMRGLAIVEVQHRDGEGDQ